MEYSNSNNNIPSYNNNNNNNINQSNNNQYNYQPSKYSSLLPNGELKPEDKKMLEKYDDYCSKNRFTYEHNNIHCYPRYNYNINCDDILNRYNCVPDPCCYRNYLYNRQPKQTYMYSNLSSKNNFDYNFKKVYPENLLHNTKFENYHVPNSQLNYNSQMPKFNNNLNYKRYFRNEDFSNNKKENNNIEYSEVNNLKNESSNININQKANEESNIININNNNNIEQDNQENSKSNMKENENNNKSQSIPKKNYYHFNASYNNNYINDNINHSYKPQEPKNNNNKKEIIINNSPCDYYYNTLHEEYLPKKEENIPLNNNCNNRRTYEIDSSKWNDNNSSLLCHSSLLNDLVRKNCYHYNYDCYC